MKKYTKVMTIAGSDSGGGAGIQADLKTFSACGCFGTSAITAITAQNTCGVSDIHPIPADTIAAQIRAILDDIGTDAIKIGMLHSSEVISTVAEVLTKYHCKNIVLDPVMVATSGDRLIKEDAVTSLMTELIPMVSLITPNIPEAEILCGRSITDKSAMIDAAKQLGEELSVSVLIKGGHLPDQSVMDILVDVKSKEVTTFENRRIETKNSHGTGCTLSSAIASFTAKAMNLTGAVHEAEQYLHAAIQAGSGYTVGQGHGPVHHFHAFWQNHQGGTPS